MNQVSWYCRSSAEREGDAKGFASEGYGWGKETAFVYMFVDFQHSFLRYPHHLSESLAFLLRLSISCSKWLWIRSQQHRSHSHQLHFSIRNNLSNSQQLFVKDLFFHLWNLPLSSLTSPVQLKSEEKGKEKMKRMDRRIWDSLLPPR